MYISLNGSRDTIQPARCIQSVSHDLEFKVCCLKHVLSLLAQQACVQCYLKAAVHPGWASKVTAAQGLMCSPPRHATPDMMLTVDVPCACRSITTHGYMIL